MTPPEGTRLVLFATELLEQLGTRTDDGRKITAEWGEPSPEGWYEPTFTATDDGWTDALRAEGARQERERLRGLEASTDGKAGRLRPRWRVDWLLKDPA